MNEQQTMQTSTSAGVKRKQIVNKLLTALFIVALVLLLLTVSIGLPIYCRFLYYIQINTLNLCERTGWSYDVIKTAYDEVLDFCTLAWVTEFSAGALKFSESGAAHFADCKVLFNLNLSVMICSAAAVLTLTVLHMCKIIELVKIKGRAAYFWAAIAAVALPVLLALIIAIVGFDRAFVAFHSVFFPGKSNWMFNSRTDEIINVMPQEFFMNCVIVIAVGLVALSAGLIITDIVLRRKEKNAHREA